jgi:glycerophosphoryl diester phosphodiesterase
MFIAHRGSVSSNVKENSLEAFQNAIINFKYGGFELDVRETIDHEFVITHDFLFNGNLVNKTTLANLESSGLISLDTVLKLNTEKLILIEIKDFNINVSKLANTLNKAHKNIYVMSFNVSVIRKIKPYAKYFKCGLINYIFNRQNNYEDFNFIALLNDTLTYNIKEYFLKRNIEIFSYGIDNKIIYDNSINYIIDNYKDYVIE